MGAVRLPVFFWLASRSLALLFDLFDRNHQVSSYRVWYGGSISLNNTLAVLPCLVESYLVMWQTSLAISMS